MTHIAYFTGISRGTHFSAEFFTIGHFIRGSVQLLVNIRQLSRQNKINMAKIFIFSLKKRLKQSFWRKKHLKCLNYGPETVFRTQKTV
jgi:hypothetical protein